MNNQAADIDAMICNIQISYKTNKAEDYGKQSIKKTVNKWVLRAVLKVWSEEITRRPCGSLFQNLAAETH